MKYASGIALSLRNEMITKLSQSEKKDYRSRYAALSDEGRLFQPGHREE